MDTREAQARSHRERPRKAAQLRADTLNVLRDGSAAGSRSAVAANLFAHLPDPARRAALPRRVGAELSAVDAFAAFAVAFWAGAVFPITGSGLGVVDAVLVAALIELSSVSDDVLVAAALLWRVIIRSSTLPLGAITLARFRKRNPGVLRPGATT